MNKYDLVVIGSGAGLMVLEEALNRGMKCAIIENSKFGGTCLTKGCIPSKMLVYPADLIREIEGSGRIGIITSKPQIDWEKISDRMWEQIDLHKKIEKNLESIPNLTVYKGTGSFSGPDSMVIRYDTDRPEDEIRGDNFIIAAGARTFVPPVEGLEETGYLTSESFFGEKFPEKPWKSLVIIGGGAISAEFAHIFSSFGTKVTVIERNPYILGTEEEEIRDFVTNQFIKKGIDVITGSNVISASRDAKGKTITIEDQATKSRSTIECDEIFVASGIRSNADTLSLKNTDVEVDGKGWVITNQYLETSQKNIWALGDINGKYQFRHMANHEAGILIQNLFGDGEKKQVSYDSVPWAIFTHPQVAHVGMTERELRDKGIKYTTAKNYYSEVVGGRAMGFRNNDSDNGFVKLIVGENKKILGVHIVGPHAAVLVQPFVYLMNSGHVCNRNQIKSQISKGIEDLRIICPQIGTYIPISDSIVIHPSLSELTAWVLEKIDWQE